MQSPSPGLDEPAQPMLSASAPAATPAIGGQADKLGRGKRKRTTSKAAVQPLQPQAPNTASYPHLQPLPAEGAATAGAAETTAQEGGGLVPQAAPPAKAPKGPHRRAFSSSASDKVAQRPIPALRRLKFRLSAVSETAVLESDTSSASIASGVDLSTASLPAPTMTTTKKITLSNPKATMKASSTKQPKNKRTRTQSMSHRTNTTASFPFDDLHLHHSMQPSQTGLPSSLHNAPSFHTSASGEGTLFPFEMHIPSSPANALDLLTSRSAPESNIFSPALAGGHHHHHHSHHAHNPTPSGASTSYIAGPFSRSHSPSSSLLSYHHHSGRRSLPPNYGNEDEQNEADSSTALEYDGWGMEQDHLDAHASASTLKDGKHQIGEHSFHEAMLKNDDIDFAFDFSLGSLGESASRPYIDDDELQGGNLSLEESREGDESRVEDSLIIGDEGGSHVADASKRSRSSTVQDTTSPEKASFAKSVMDSMLDGLDGDGDDAENSNETVKEAKQKRPSSLTRRTSSHISGDVDMSAETNDSQEPEAEQSASAEQEEGEEQDEEEDHAALLDRKAFEKALNTTLCPAAAKFSSGMDGSSKAARLLMKRMNSSSNLTFARTVPKTSTSSEAMNRSPTATPLLRPALPSRTHSRDVLSTAVPLAELPSIPLENSRRDSFLFYHLTSDADHPLDYLDAGKENDNNTRDDMSDAASSSSASTSSSLLTRIVKSEEELDDMVDMEEHAQGSPSTHRGVSRCCSTASAISRAEVESNDSFNPEMIYAIGRRAPSAELGNIGGQGEIDELQQLHTSRSQSSSRTTSLSPRDSFSPNMVGPHGSSSSDLDADWALTPPSEEEHVDEDEKNLDRATMLGLESVGMDDLDDVWPGVRRSLGGAGAASSNASGSGGSIEAQVDGVTCDFKIMEVFEPVLPAAPIPQVDLPSPVFTLGAALKGKSEGAEGADDSAMDIDKTPMDEHTAAAMFIADESLHPPKPSPMVTFTPAPEETESVTPQPSLSPVSAAAKEASTSADAQQPTSSAVNDSSHRSSKVAGKEASTTPVQQQQQALEPPASTQSFLFNPDVPFHPEISILLTDTKILFYSTIVNVSNDGRPLLRRVDNDAVDAEALLLSLEGASDMDGDRLETLRKIKEMGNTWVSLDFARELLKKYGGPEPLVSLLKSTLFGEITASH